ncbi:MAG: hypothetical protein H6862_01495 [Rhodospirillales bacterium]|nr:hypothetical protein [Rhodospirillales bacterium]
MRIFLGVALFLVGLIGMLYGLIGTYVLCVFFLEEYINGVRLVNWYHPDTSSLLSFWHHLPSLFLMTFSRYDLSAFVTILFFPMISFLVPLWAGFSSGNWTLVAFGWGPFLGGCALSLLGAAAWVRERERRKRKKNENAAPPPERTP